MLELPIGPFGNLGLERLAELYGVDFTKYETPLVCRDFNVVDTGTCAYGVDASLKNNRTLTIGAGLSEVFAGDAMWLGKVCSITGQSIILLRGQCARLSGNFCMFSYTSNLDWNARDLRRWSRHWFPLCFNSRVN